MNKNFKVDQRVVCTVGLNKGKEFIIKAILDNGYSLQLADESDNQYYGYSDQWLEEAK